MNKKIFIFAAVILGLTFGLSANSTYDCPFLGKTIELTYLFQVDYGQDGVKIYERGENRASLILSFTDEGSGILDNEKPFGWYYEDGPEFDSEQIYTGGIEDLMIQSPYYSLEGAAIKTIFRVKDDLIYAWFPVSRSERNIIVYRFKTLE